MKRGKLILIIILCTFFICIAIFVSIILFSVPKLKKDLTLWKNGDYSQLQYGSRLEEFLPKYNGELKYSNAEFYYHKGCANFDYAEAAYCLELDYSETEYNQTIESVQLNYSFFNEIPLENDKLALENYKIGDYDIHLVEISGPFPDEIFPGEIEIIAFNKSVNRIRYCYIVDMRLDYLENEADFQWWITNNLKINW